MQKKTENTGQFTAVDTAGKSYVVLEYTEFINASALMDEQTQWEPSYKSYRLDNGGAVNQLDDGTFKIVATDVIVRKKHR